jgi:hypothetical protein
MKVFFTASLSEREKYKKYYDTVVKTVQKNDEIISLEVQEYSHLIPKDIIKSIPKNELHYTWLKKGIKKSNCVIIDASRDSFRLGHEATLALLYNKPVLCLSDKKDYSYVIINPKFYAAVYKDEKEVASIVGNFLQLVKRKHMGLRKNIYITSEYANFLNWYSKSNSKNDSEVIRELIKNLMEQNPEYENADIDDLDIKDAGNEE